MGAALREEEDEMLLLRKSGMDPLGSFVPIPVLLGFVFPLTKKFPR